MRYVLQVLVVVAFLIIAANVSYAQQLSVSLNSSTVDGKQVCGLSLDELTDLMGRPTAVDKQFEAIIGTTIIYHDKGLEFMVAPKDQNDIRPVRTMRVHFSKKWDERSNEYAQPFSGVLQEGFTAEWKAEKVENYYASAVENGGAKIQIETPEEQKEQANRISKEFLGDMSHPYFIRIDVNNRKLNFLHEPTTKFLEEVTVTCNAQAIQDGAKEWLRNETEKQQHE